MHAKASASTRDVTPEKSAHASGWWKLVTLLSILAAAGIFSLFFREYLTFDFLAEKESELRQWKAEAPWISAAIALSIYIGVTGLSLPGASALSLVLGWFFGFWRALLIVSFASTAGATLAFLLSRYVARDWVRRKFSKRSAAIDEVSHREGAYYLFTLRLIPAIPFFVINLVMGLTNIRWTTFWWVSQLGMLPGTAAYVYAGSTVPSIKKLAADGIGQIVSWQFITALIILGFLPLLIKRTVVWYSARRAAP